MKRFHLVLGVLDGEGPAERDVNGMLWERVTADQQAVEIWQTQLSLRPRAAVWRNRRGALQDAASSSILA